MTVRKILFISDHGDPLAELGGEQAGGQNNYVKQLMHHLCDRGMLVDVVTHWSDETAPQIERYGKSGRVIRIAAGRKGFVPKEEMVNFLDDIYKEMKIILNLKEYDIIHSHYWMSGLLGLAVKEEFGIPSVHTSHSLGTVKAAATGVREERRLRAEKRILRKADRVIATTPTEKETIIKFAGPKTDVSVIPIGVAKSFEETSLQKPPAKPHFVYAGRFEETKGLFTLLKAFQDFVKEGQEGELVLAGGDEEDIDAATGLPVTAGLRDAINGIEDRVTFVGPKSQEELAALFSEATAVVVPSYYESFGMVAAEAQRCGTPVIASGVGGLQDVVQDGQTGILVPPKDSKALKSAMHTLAGERHFAETLGHEAMKRATLLFTWSTIAELMLDLYEVVDDEENSSFISDGS
ncbi:glycosyltransferase [Lacicoccus alkaliphilus]|uniref:Glycosyltransferase involved in cell wall bisynthesis n=1 Tax=Lacicoccus alkaliphilus DSM 16010 TaxID=1123231 RepID=A0A1M7GY32_9BACL|nr:glycosyltransferase [Salinicoccus alkaliphilus]SHM21046.1 Glycosyltransferase involved in cell wall bisynthesis [Salinicoccus alkaliphilus DSM 16010]